MKTRKQMEKRKRKKVVTTASIINIMQRWLLTAIEFILSFQALGTGFVRVLYGQDAHRGLSSVSNCYRISILLRVLLEPIVAM